MKKYHLFFLSLLIVFIGVIGLTSSVLAAPSDEKVEVIINTRQKEGEKVQGTDHLNFTIYDLTSWRQSTTMSEKEAKEYLLDKNVLKEEMQSFIRTQDLKALGEEPLVVNSEGEAKFLLPRYQDNKDAAYLILASGETGKFRFLPIVLFFPQYAIDSNIETFKVMIHGKYAEQQELVTTVPPGEVAKQTENPKASAVTSHKTLPQTNDFVKSYSLLGGVLLISAIMGLKKTQKYRGKK